MTRARDEGGWAVVIVLVLMLIMAGVAASTMGLVDNQQRQSAVGRQRETSFNIAEATLNAQIHTLALPGRWPGQGAAVNAAIGYPTSCTQMSTDARCPSAATIAGLFSSPDTARGLTWTTMVRDNSGVTGAQTFWNDSMIAAAPSYDANGDGRVWVRAQASVLNHRRTMVALVRAEQQQEEIPHATLIAGRLAISNQGNKVIIDARGTSASTGAVQVRCSPVLLESVPCLGHVLGQAPTQTLVKLISSNNSQIVPNATSSGYAGGAALTADARERLRQSAIDNGTYFTSCPSSLTGAIVYIDTSTTCSYSANGQYNSATAPGMVLLTQGGLSLGGTLDFYGLIYHANLNNATGDVVSLNGNVQIHGGILVDGNAGVIAGSSKVNIEYSDAAFSAVKSYGSAGLIQNTWREIKG